MVENCIFSGYGHALGEYSIDNKELEEAVQSINSDNIEEWKISVELAKRKPSLLEDPCEMKMAIKKEKEKIECKSIISNIKKKLDL